MSIQLNTGQGQPIKDASASGPAVKPSPTATPVATPTPTPLLPAADAHVASKSALLPSTAASIGQAQVAAAKGGLPSLAQVDDIAATVDAFVRKCRGEAGPPVAMADGPPLAAAARTAEIKTLSDFIKGMPDPADRAVARSALDMLTLSATPRANAAQLLKQLVGLVDAKPNELAPGINHQKLVLQTLTDLAEPYTINQGAWGTCGATCVQISVALRDPERYVELVRNLADVDATRAAAPPPTGMGIAGLRRADDQDLTASTDKTGDARTLTTRLISPALMNCALGERVIDASSAGLNALETEKLIKGVLNVDTKLFIASDERDKGGQAWRTAMNEIHTQATHGLVAVGLDLVDKQKHWMMYAGKSDDGSHALLIDPYGKRVAMPIADFEQAVENANVPTTAKGRIPFPETPHDKSEYELGLEYCLPGKELIKDKRFEYTAALEKNPQCDGIKKFVTDNSMKSWFVQNTLGPLLKHGLPDAAMLAEWTALGNTKNHDPGQVGLELRPIIAQLSACLAAMSGAERDIKQLQALATAEALTPGVVGSLTRGAPQQVSTNLANLASVVEACKGPYQGEFVKCLDQIASHNGGALSARLGEWAAQAGVKNVTPEVQAATLEKIQNQIHLEAFGAHIKSLPIDAANQAALKKALGDAAVPFSKGTLSSLHDVAQQGGLNALTIADFQRAGPRAGDVISSIGEASSRATLRASILADVQACSQKTGLNPAFLAALAQKETAADLVDFIDESAGVPVCSDISGQLSELNRLEGGVSPEFLSALKQKIVAFAGPTG